MSKLTHLKFDVDRSANSDGTSIAHFAMDKKHPETGLVLSTKKYPGTRWYSSPPPYRGGEVMSTKRITTGLLVLN